MENIICPNCQKNLREVGVFTIRHEINKSQIDISDELAEEKSIECIDCAYEEFTCVNCEELISNQEVYDQLQEIIYG